MDAAARNLFVTNGRVVREDGAEWLDILITEGRVSAISKGITLPAGCPILDADGNDVFPGLIDPQVHFREPGMMHQEDLSSGSLAAIAGGVVAFLEMPNTKPATTTPESLRDKMRRARGNSWADYGFFLGATAENADMLGEWEAQPGCCGIQVFMGSSTGDLLVPDDATLERVLRSGTKRVAVHCEDEERLRTQYANLAPGATVHAHPEVRDVATAVRATTRLLDLVEKTGRRVHLSRVSTAEEIGLLRERDLGELVTAAVTPNHLFLHAPDCYDAHGTLAQMDPPVRDLRHRDTLRQALVDGVIACIGSDHAPHTREEKERPFPRSPSGIPGVQTVLPLLLTGVRDGWLRDADVVRVTASAPARIWGIESKGQLEVGSDGDLVLVDRSERGPLQGDWLRSKSGWSPYVGAELAGWPHATILRGRIVYDAHRTVGEPSGQRLEFD